MMQRPEQHIFQMLDGCRFVLELTAGKTIEDYKQDRPFRSALERELIVHGGRMARLTASHPADASMFTEPNSIIELREHLIHRYFDIDATEVWHFLTENLPILKSELEQKITNGAH